MEKSEIIGLFKILNETMNEDNEACLFAIRYANKILNDHNLDWESFISEEDNISFNKKENLTRNINEMLDFIFSKGRENDFIKSLKDWYSEKGSLTYKQFTILNKIYKSILEEEVGYQ